MEAVALQRIAQWEQSHHKGNKKPLTTRVRPALQSISVQERRALTPYSTCVMCQGVSTCSVKEGHSARGRQACNIG